MLGTAHGNEYLYDSAQIVKRDVEVAYEVDDLGKSPEIEIVYANIMDEVEGSNRLSPILKLDNEYITKAKPEVLMNKMYSIINEDRKARKKEKNK